MPQISSLANDKSVYQADGDSASQVFGLKSNTFYRNYPRVPFEYYIQINLDNSAIAQDYFKRYFVSPTEFQQIQPLVKTIEMPSMKIDTLSLNQYNRKRIAQNKISFEPIKAVFHDVADGKTLAFWEMYYSYYFRDGFEAGNNSPKVNSQQQVPYSNQFALPDGAVIPQNFLPSSTSLTSPTSNDGDKKIINDVLSDTLVNHNFGANSLSYSGSWPNQWDKQKNLIQSIEIFQVHGGRYNKVTLVNPRISAFAHDTLNYAGSDKSLELTFTFEYEYAFYNTENLKLDTNQLQIFENNYHELNGEQFKVTSNSPFSVESGNPQAFSNLGTLPTISTLTGNNLQASTGSVIGSQFGNSINGVFNSITSLNGYSSNSSSSSSLSGLLNVGPLPLKTIMNPKPAIKSFVHTKISRAKEIAMNNALGIVQGGIVQAEDYVLKNVEEGISGAKAYVPVDLASPISKVFGSLF